MKQNLSKESICIRNNDNEIALPMRKIILFMWVIMLVEQEFIGLEKNNHVKKFDETTKKLECHPCMAPASNSSQTYTNPDNKV